MTMLTKAMKPEEASGLPEVCAGMLSASGKVGISLMVKLCLRMLDETGMANKCANRPTNFQWKERCWKL